MAAHAATKFPEEEKQSCGRAGEALAVRGGTRRHAPSTKLSSCCPFGVYLKRSVRETALIPPVPPPPSSFAAAAIPSSSSKLKTVPTVRVGKKDEGGENRKWPRVVDSRCILLVFFFSLLHVSSSSSLRAPRHNHTNKTSKMDGELKYAAGNYSDCSGMAGEKNTPPHTPTPLSNVSDWMRSKRRDTVRLARREDDASASSASLSRF